MQIIGLIELFLSSPIKSIILRTSCKLQGNSNLAFFLCSLSDVWESQGINISGFPTYVEHLLTKNTFCFDT